MKKGEIYEGRVKEVSFPNKGHIDIDGINVIVKNTIPGQRIKFMISKKRNGRFEGRLLELLEKSPLERREARCSLFPECGGCVYQTIDADAQADMKYAQVKELLTGVLKEYGRFEEEDALSLFRGIITSPEIWAYRNKMEYSFGDPYKDGPLSLGFHKKGSNFDILTAKDCALVHDDMNKVVECVLEHCSRAGPDYYHKTTHTGFLRHLLCRRSASTGEMLVALVTSTQSDYDFFALSEELLGLKLDGMIAGIMHMENDSVADVVRSDRTKLLFGNDFIYEEILGLRFKITPFSFFQTNTKGAELLYSVVRDMIGDIEGAVVFDLYSGTGTIAQVLSSAAKKVIGIEIVEEAVYAARENAVLNGLSNCEFYAGDVLKVLDEMEERPDFLVLDPPREGINPKAIQKIIDYRAQRIVYISCKPTSLANDLKAFLQGGYKVEMIKCADIFSNTVHIETIVLLQRETL